MGLYRCCACFGWMLIMVFNAVAAPLPAEKVPEPLRPWIDWVLEGEEDRVCPSDYDAGDQRHCVWPTELQLELNAKGGVFSGSWRSYRETRIVLPGGREHWPEEVTLDGAKAVVTLQDQRPVLWAGAGLHRIQGRFEWQKLPETLALPPAAAIVRLRLNDEVIAFPAINADGALWLQQQGADRVGERADGDALEVTVFRRIVDSIPLRLVTRLELNVSGAAREIRLGPVLPEAFIPLALKSPLPARLEADGRLLLQLRPGRWSIELTARHPHSLLALGPSSAQPPWPEAEVWVFEARTSNRLVEVEGAATIDPQQTRLPADWKAFPAYRLTAAERLRFKLIRRGDPDPEPDQLKIRRNIWLDFDGGGYTVNDEISGTMTRGWRLNVLPELDLGRVSIDDQPQLITRLQNSGAEGVEVRRGTIKLSADSRHQGAVAAFNAVGWDQDFQTVSTVLHLPPGWRLLAATGVDNVPATWLYRWTLLDLFLVLITALAVARLWNWSWGLLALVGLVLIWHEAGAPRFVWLNILAAVALLRVLPPGRFRVGVQLYRNLALLGLVLIAVPFIVAQVRSGLYPQLELPWQSVTPRAQPAAQQEARSGARESKDEVAVMEAAPMSAPLQKKTLQSLRREPLDDAVFDQIDPKAKVQTGPGLPQWHWRRIDLRWNGPVQRDQRVGLTLIPPALNLLLNLLRVAGVLVFAMALLKQLWRGGNVLPRLENRAAALVLLGGLLPLLQPVESRAAIPGPDLLDQLKSRLLAPADCLPACADIAFLQLQATEQTLTLRLQVHAAEAVAIPLPGHAGDWLPAEVSVDGERARGLLRTPAGGLNLSIEAGLHRIILEGPLPPRQQLTIPLPLIPRRMQAQVAGWRLEGLHESGMPERQLQLTRLQRQPADSMMELEPVALPPFLEVVRTLHLGLDWRVSTRVRRVSPADSAVVAEIPLLPGESVVSAGIRLAQGRVLVNLSPGQFFTAWDSVLEKSPQLRLTAPQTSVWSEVWRLDISPIWHPESDGIPVVHHQGPEGRWLPEWRPWPGESVNLSITRLAAVAGNTLTVDQTLLRSQPGKRASDSSLTLTLRSSQGGQHSLTLPEGARLQSVSIDGRPQPVRQSGQVVTLPLRPGKQQFVLSWRQGQGVGTWFMSPTLDLGSDSVNASIQVQLGQDRWVLWTGGPRLGPAVLFWGVLLVIMLLAIGLGRVKLTPLKGWHWFLLLLGLSQIPVAGSVLVIAWLMGLGWHRCQAPAAEAWRFNIRQVGLGLLTLLALGLLFQAIQQGLLGTPEMQIAGNRSNAHTLNWYQDHSGSRLPQPWIISVPLFVYRLLMLAWSLWLAYSLLAWLKWGWSCFSAHGLWRAKPAKPVAGSAAGASAEGKNA